VKTKAWMALVARYHATLAAYVAREDEEGLQRAYELGRKALTLGLGVMDVARLHQEAVMQLVSRNTAPVANARWARAVETFLMEALSAFEVAHRGFRDACERLVRLNGTLQQRHGELAVNLRKLAREVVRRKNAQELLTESELKFRSVVESAQDAIITVDSRGRLVAVNRGTELMFGWRRSELVGRSVTRLIPRPMRAAAVLTLQGMAKGGEREHLKRPIQSVGLHRDGTEFSLEFTLSRWRTRSGVFFTGVVRDIRERKQAELALRQSREHYMRLFEEAREMEQNLRLLSSKVLTVQEEERKHISRELHDEIGQALTAVNVSIAMLRSHGGADEEFRKKVDNAQLLLEQSMNMVHQFARELRPSMLDHLGPVAALQNYVKSFTERTGIKTDIEGSVSVEQLDNQQRTVLYRVAQESLTNVYKHAHATRVKIRLSQLPRAVRMEIVDNGRSFSVSNPFNGQQRQPLGLLGMQERVRLVNGQFAIESVPKRGTTVRVEIPLPANDGIERTALRDVSTTLASTSSVTSPN
jgi:PAS domain S-box-containing protein